MARIRSIKPEFQNSGSMGRVSRDARLTFILLWPQCDDAGRMRADSRMLASTLFPYDEDAPKLIDGWLIELENEGCIVRYEHNKDKYLAVVNFFHQKIDRPSPSKLPPPPEQKKKKTKASSREKAPNDTRASADHSSLDQGREGIKEGIKDQGGEKVGAEPQAAHALAITDPPIITLPTNREGEEIAVFRAQVLDYEKTYPNVDVEQQLRSMRRWLIDNRTKRKTAGGMMRFVNTWLSREQDKNHAERPRNGNAGPAEGKQVRALGRFLGEAEEDSRAEPPSSRGVAAALASDAGPGRRQAAEDHYHAPRLGRGVDEARCDLPAAEQHERGRVEPEIPDFLLRSSWPLAGGTDQRVRAVSDRSGEPVLSNAGAAAGARKGLIQ